MRTKTFFYCVMFGMHLLISSGVFAADQPVMVHLDGKTTLKTLFDAGLRPTRVYSAQHTEVEVQDKDILFLLPPSIQIRIPAEEVRFSIGANDIVMELQAKSANMTLDDAYAQAVAIFGSVGQIPPNLQEAIESARANRRFAPLGEIGVAHRPLDGPELRVGFLPGDFNPAYPNHLHVRIGVTAYWKDRVHNSGNLRKEPIKPPPGYETHSMEPIQTANEQRLVESRQDTPAPLRDVLTHTETREPAQPTTPVDEQKSPAAEDVPAEHSYLGWAVLFIALIGCSLLIFFGRRT